MAATLAMDGIQFAYERDGEVRCQNPKGLTFFLHSDPAPKKAAQATAWQPVQAVKEVEVRHASAAPASQVTAEASQGSRPVEKGWLGKLFQRD